MSSAELVPCTVLIVDDERIVALELQRTLERLGFVVAPTAGRREHALEIAQAHPPQIVFMDLRLHGVQSGVEIALELRERFEFGLIYMTGGADAAEQRRAAAARPAAWLQKPYSKSQLDAALQAALTQRLPPFAAK